MKIRACYRICVYFTEHSGDGQVSGSKPKRGNGQGGNRMCLRRVRWRARANYRDAHKGRVRVLHRKNLSHCPVVKNSLSRATINLASLLSSIFVKYFQSVEPVVLRDALRQ